MNTVQFVEAFENIVSKVGPIPPAFREEFEIIPLKESAGYISSKGGVLVNLLSNYSFQRVGFGDYHFLKEPKLLNTAGLVFAQSSHSYLCTTSVDGMGEILDIDRFNQSELYSVAESEESFLAALLHLTHHYATLFTNDFTEGEIDLLANECVAQCASAAGGPRYLPFYMSVLI